MRLIEFLDKGASLGPESPCLTMNDTTATYADVVALSRRVGGALVASGVTPGDKVAIISSNDPTAFTCVFAISRAGAVWCPINPRNEALENTDQLDLFDTSVVLYQAKFEELVSQIAPNLPKVKTWVCLDGEGHGQSFRSWIADAEEIDDVDPVDDVAMIAGTGGTTGRPKGVQLTGHNLEAMSAITLMSYPFSDRPRYLALAPLTHAAGVLCFPIMAKGGEIVIMPAPDVAELIRLIPAHTITHVFLPPTVIYMLLDHPELANADLSSLQVMWYGAAPMSASRLKQAVTTIGPVMAQLYGQTEAPMMISTMSPDDHLAADGQPAVERFTSAGKPSPLCTVAILGDDELAPLGERGEVVVRGPLVTPAYYNNPEATAEARWHGWHRTGDIGFIDADGWLSIVDRAKDMIITGGYNVYSTEVEQAVAAHPAIREVAVVGLPDEKWGERIVAVCETHDVEVTAEEVMAFAKDIVGSVKSPKQVEFWDELPRSKIGKVVKPDVRERLVSP